MSLILFITSWLLSIVLGDSAVPFGSFLCGIPLRKVPCCSSLFPPGGGRRGAMWLLFCSIPSGWGDDRGEGGLMVSGQRWLWIKPPVPLSFNKRNQLFRVAVLYAFMHQHVSLTGFIFMLKRLFFNAIFYTSIKVFKFCFFFKYRNRIAGLYVLYYMHINFSNVIRYFFIAIYNKIACIT